MSFANVARASLAGSLALFLTGCASLSEDAGMGAVNGIVRRDLSAHAVKFETEADLAHARAEVVRLLKRPLTADRAVQIALLNNRELQAAYNELGIADAVRLRSSLPPNPSFSISAIGGSAELEVERKIAADIIALATLPQRTQIANTRFRRAQLRASLETLRIAAEARRAYYRAVGAKELVGISDKIRSAAQSTAAVALELGKTGAMNKLDQAREQAFYAETAAQLAAARRTETAEREGLIRALGLWGSDVNVRLPDALPPLPNRPRSLPTIEAQAVRERVDLQIARADLEASARAYGLADQTRLINALRVGTDDKTTKNKETGEVVRDHGLEVSFEIPIFDLGEARRAEAEQTYLRGINRLAALAANVRSQAREAYLRYRASYDLARHYEREILPLQKIINDESQLRFSAMIVDVFALLADARERIAANRAALAAKQDYWLADAALRSVLVGGGGGSEPSAGAQSSVSNSETGNTSAGAASNAGATGD